MTDGTEKLQAEMDELAQSFHDLREQSLCPCCTTTGSFRRTREPPPMFMHTGWIHLIGNMWFLWLAGFILEENWGCVIYARTKWPNTMKCRSGFARSI